MPQGRLVEFECEQCGKIAKGTYHDVSKRRRRFCSRSCASRYKMLVRHKNGEFLGSGNGNYKGDRALTPYQHKLRQIEKYPERVKARKMLHDAVRRGKIAREVCAVCGDPNTQAHHTDYSKPYDVEWLCSVCHKKEHNGRSTGRPMRLENE